MSLGIASKCGVNHGKMRHKNDYKMGMMLVVLLLLVDENVYF